MELGSTLERQKYGITSQNGIYRAAFPAFRVFIYGEEVSGDVIEVRVNQSGGSMDRSPGTFSVSLANIGDKYILDHNDMVALASSRDQLVSSLGENVAAYKDLVGSIRDGVGEDENVVSEMGRILSSSGRFSELAEYYASYYSELLKTGYYQGSWDENKVPDFIKYNIIKKKAPLVVPQWQAFYEEFKKDGSYLTKFFLNKEGFIYPFAEGDCVFHPNDPVRIAFRDPFDPSTWYWSFTGFVDGFVEDRGANQESIVTITGTDVTKMARYSMFQTSTDAVRDAAITKLFPIFESTTTEVKWTAYAELFAHFTIFEMLELLFFGLEAYKPSITEFVKRACAQMYPAEVDQFLTHSATKQSTEELKGMSYNEKVALMKDYMGGDKTTRFEGARFPPLQTPQGTKFQRKDEKYGTYAFFIGKADNYDKAMGTEIPITELRSLNDFLNHRVTENDPMIMGSTSKAKTYWTPSITLNDVITQIGRNIEDYPVGAGRVVYVAPSGLGLGVSSGVMDEVMNAAGGGLHSEFKDRLTYLYDLAEQIQFCFYATPRGDVVFEMPFYDFDPWVWDSAGTFLSNDTLDTAAAAWRKTLNDLRLNVEKWSKGSVKYSEKEIYQMMQLSSDLQLVQEGFSLTESDNSATNYSDYYTINKHETYGYSNALNDSGLKTFARCAPYVMERMGEGFNPIDMREYQFVYVPALAPLLGFRAASDKSPWTQVTSAEGAQIFASLDLRKCNAEARTLNIQVLPHFGFMVNRTLYWRQRNYVASIVSCSHSIAVNSSCETQVNVNYARAWTGEYAEGNKSPKMEVFRHFGGDLPFSYAVLLDANK